MVKSLYLAGPDVFLTDAAEVGRAKRELCSKFGFRGLFPLDVELSASGLAPKNAGEAIYRENVKLMRSADAIVANLTPFRGPSADVGTAFEVGFFAALGKPIFAYTSDMRGFTERCRAWIGAGAGAATDPSGASIENFGLPDNLMLPEAVRSSGGTWVARRSLPGRELAALEAFEECLRRLRHSLPSSSNVAAAG